MDFIRLEYPLKVLDGRDAVGTRAVVIGGDAVLQVVEAGLYAFGAFQRVGVTEGERTLNVRHGMYFISIGRK